MSYNVHLHSPVWLFATPWTAARQAPLSFMNWLKLMSIESVMPSSHLILCRPLLLLPPIPPNIRVFSSESTLHLRWPKDWSFSFSISPSNEHPGLISFRMDWLDLLAVPGAVKSLLQHHHSKASILRRCIIYPSVLLILHVVVCTSYSIFPLLPSGNRQFVLWVSESLSVWLYTFILLSRCRRITEYLLFDILKTWCEFVLLHSVSIM